MATGLEERLSTGLEERLDGALARLVGEARSRPRRVMGWVLALTAVLLPYSVLNLGVNTDHTQMLSPEIPSQRAHIEFSRLFPILDDAILIVVDADTPELVREATESLQSALIDARYIRRVYEPGGGDFFERHGLLYRSVEELEEFADHMASMQPIIGVLEADPSLASFTKLVRLGLERTAGDLEAAEQWSEILDRVNQAAVSVYSEYPLSVSWQELLLRGSALAVRTRRVLVADPVLDFSSLLPAGDAIEEIRARVAASDLTPERGIRVRLTGNPVLNHEEMLGLAWDVGGASIFCFALVAVVIRRALGSWRLTTAALTTLLVGLIWTGAFAAAAIGHVNLVSICFAILFIGLGVDFSIHLGMQYAQLRRTGVAHDDALDRAVRTVGSSLVLCTLTTSIGFYAFVPTDYVGVGELGLIAGTGMGIILLLTLTLFPALLSLGLRPHDDAPVEAGLHFAPRWFEWIGRHAVAVRVAGAVLGFAGLALAPFADFDPDVVKMRDESTESVQAFGDLLAQNDLSSPWFANALAADLDAAAGLAERLRQLEVVDEVVTLRDFVPREQAEKREILADLAFLYDVPPTLTDPAAGPSPASQVKALRELRDFLDVVSAVPGSDLAASVLKLRDEFDVFLERVDRDGDPSAALQALERALLGRLPRQMELMRSAFAPEEVTLESLPPDLQARMVAPDGRARVQAFPRKNLAEDRSFEEFVAAISSVVERPTGLAVNLVEFGRVVVDAMIQALATAVVLISGILWLLWRRPREMFLVLVPLALAGALSVGAMALMGLSFNFANVIVLPLMLGIGVDSAIHLVHRARSEKLAVAGLMSTTTARAIFFSALTTIASFGSLAFSSHRGMASLGNFLVIGMVSTLFANLVVLPALLARRPTSDRPEP